MTKRALLISFSILLLILPLTAWAVNVPAKIYENGANDTPVAQSGMKVDVFAGNGFKTLLSSGESDAAGACLLSNVPLGKDVLVRLAKPGYVTQYDVRSYSEADAEEGVIFWTGSEANVTGLYGRLGETFDGKKGQVYLEISDELTEEGIEGIALTASSGKVFELGGGEYLIANASGASVKIGISKPGYAFDVESATIPLYAGAMTQYYVKVQSGGAVGASAKPVATSGSITGTIKTTRGGQPISGVTVAFVEKKTQIKHPSVLTKSDGTYSQGGFPIKTAVIVTPSKSGYTFKPATKTVKTKSNGKPVKADFKGTKL